MAAGTCRAPAPSPPRRGQRTKAAAAGAGGSLRGPQPGLRLHAPVWGDGTGCRSSRALWGSRREVGLGWAVCPAAGPGAIWQAGRDEVRLDDAQGRGRFATRGLCFGNTPQRPRRGAAAQSGGNSPLRHPDSSWHSPTTTGGRGRPSRAPQGMRALPRPPGEPGSAREHTGGCAEVSSVITLIFFSFFFFTKRPPSGPPYKRDVHKPVLENNKKSFPRRNGK